MSSVAWPALRFLSPIAPARPWTHTLDRALWGVCLCPGIEPAYCGIHLHPSMQVHTLGDVKVNLSAENKATVDGFPETLAGSVRVAHSPTLLARAPKLAMRPPARASSGPTCLRNRPPTSLLLNRPPTSLLLSPNLAGAHAGARAGDHDGRVGPAPRADHRRLCRARSRRAAPCAGTGYGGPTHDPSMHDSSMYPA